MSKGGVVEFDGHNERFPVAFCFALWWKESFYANAALTGQHDMESV